MSKKLLMIAENDISSTSSLGVTKKLRGQYKAFCNLGYDTYLLCLENENAVLIHGKDKEIAVNKQIKGYFTVAKLFLSAPRICRKKQIDICYIRYPLADWAFMKMVRGLHKVCKVVVEIPSYPYDEELKGNKNFIRGFNFIQDKINRNKLNLYIDIVVAVGEDDEINNIYQIPTIMIYNGVDIANLGFIGENLDYESRISFIGVSKIVDSNGFDRIIKGINCYYNNSTNRNVYFHIVGDGECLLKLKQLVSDYNLEDYIFFHGVKTGEDLDDLYKLSNIGVTYLAGHRNNCYKTSSLKLREYCALGIPFIGSMEDDAFPQSKCSFYKLFPANDDPIDINEVIKFADYIAAHPEIHKQMRQYAEENLTWEKQLSKVIESI